MLIKSFKDLDGNKLTEDELDEYVGLNLFDLMPAFMEVCMGFDSENTSTPKEMKQILEKQKADLNKKTQ